MLQCKCACCCVCSYVELTSLVIPGNVKQKNEVSELITLVGSCVHTACTHQHAVSHRNAPLQL